MGWEKASAATRATFAAAPFVPMPGRAMKEYVVVPAAMHGKPRELRGWVDKALAHAASLPPKPKRAAKQPSA